MSSATRHDRETNLRLRFNEFRNLINPETETELFKAVDSYVDCLRRDGASPEAMVIAVKAVAKDAASVPLAGGAKHERHDLVSARLDQMITRAIQRFFGETNPADGFCR